MREKRAGCAAPLRWAGPRPPPAPPGRPAAADIDLVEHTRVDPQHLAGAGWIEHPGICKRHSDQEAVNILLFQAGVGDRLHREARHQFERRDVRRRLLPRFEFRKSDDRGLTLETHTFAAPQDFSIVPTTTKARTSVTASGLVVR